MEGCAWRFLFQRQVFSVNPHIFEPVRTCKLGHIHTKANQWREAGEFTSDLSSIFLDLILGAWGRSMYNEWFRVVRVKVGVALFEKQQLADENYSVHTQISMISLILHFRCQVLTRLWELYESSNTYENIEETFFGRDWLRYNFSGSHEMLLSYNLK